MASDESDIMKLPEFKSDEEFIEWVENNDTSAFMDVWEEVEPFEVRLTPSLMRPVDVRMRTDHMQALVAFADKRGVPYQTLVREWLVERLQMEVPELLAVS